jgi:hypothetical protein
MSVQDMLMMVISAASAEVAVEVATLETVGAMLKRRLKIVIGSLQALQFEGGIDFLLILVARFCNQSGHQLWVDFMN